MTSFNWQVVQMERLTSDGFVVTVHYNVSAQDGDFSAATYGTVSYSPEAGAEVPFEQLTESMVVGWVQAALGKDVVEASLQGQIDAQKAPKQLTGLPWAK